MMALVAKELRALLPIILLLAGLLVIDSFNNLVSLRPDELTVYDFCSRLCDTGISGNGWFTPSSDSLLPTLCFRAKKVTAPSIFCTRFQLPDVRYFGGK